MSANGAWSEQARMVLAERYLLREGGRIIEDPDAMCQRVARAVAAAERRWLAPQEITTLEQSFFELLDSRRFLPNSPTLMNAGKVGSQQLAACFVVPIQDSLEGIFEAVKDAALIHKSGAGTGFAFSRLRPAGSPLSGRRGVASGPSSFIRVFDSATEELKRGGSRRGANMGILRIDHPDILTFIDAKRDGGIRNFNLSVAVTDEFMRALDREDDSFALIDPQTGHAAGRLQARTLFSRLVEAAWDTGDPGLVFIDRINASPAAPVHPRYAAEDRDESARARIELNLGWTDPANPGIGIIESTNPCGEVPLLPFEACNLGSINLSLFSKPSGSMRPDQAIDWQALAATVALAVRFLDDVIDVTEYPLPETAEVVSRNRKIGLGVMGWADLLIELAIPYDSQEAVDLAGQVMSFLNAHAHATSEELARTRGPFPNWPRSMYQKATPLRNATLTSIAPTGTISIIAGCSSSIEPLFAIAYRRQFNGEELTFVNPLFERMARERGFYTEALMRQVRVRGVARRLAGVPDEVQRLFATAYDVAPEWHVRMQAAFQKHTDNAVSKTVNLPYDASQEDVAHVFKLAYSLGCLGITVFRESCQREPLLVPGVRE